jgi:hypothetical protein
MAFAGVTAHDFAGAGDLEPFAHGLSRFDAFGSSHKFYYFNCKRARTIRGG